MLFDDLARCREWIEAALEHTGGTHTFDDIAAGCYLGKFSLLAKSDGCAVLEIHEFPRKRALNVFLLGGELSAIGHHDELERIARDANATEITMTGRAGWARVLAPLGWDREPSVTLKKVL